MNRRHLLAAAILATLATTLPSLAESPAMLTPSTSGLAPVNGVNIHYEVYGEGKPLILIHGGFGSVGMFAPILPALAQGRQVIGVDLQAHGRTGPLGRPMTFPAMATDIAELIKFLGFETADVMGYSLGGGVALRLAIDHPAVIDRLVLVSTAYAFDNWHDYNQQGMRGIAANPDATAEGMKGSPMYQGYVAVAPGGAETWTAAVREVAALVGQDFDWSADVPNIKSPTLIVVGDWDSVRIAKATKLFEMLGGGAQDGNWDRSGLNQNRFAVLPNTTHYEAFMSPALPPVVLPFLDGYPRP
jgi:pimeloyl-ACP methyl ester carboxylesterase